MPLLSDTSPVFVGRENQLQLLTEQADRVRSGPPEGLLIGGDAGVGKSRLITEFTVTRPAGTVFVGACLQLGVDGLSYAPFTAVLRQILRERGRGPFEAAAPGGVGEFARLLPELGESPTDRRENRGILFEQVLRLFDRVAGDEGVTVVLEDLHWSDGATRDLLVFLARNLARPGTQIVATYRSDDLYRAHPLRRLLPQIERLPGVGRIQLEPLAKEAVGRQAAAIRGRELAPEELDTLFQRSEGVPLFVEALATSDPHPDRDGPDLPDHFRDLLLEPVHRFDDTALAVLRTAAVGAVSGSVEHEVLQLAAALPERELEAALHTLVDANVLRAGRTDYRFRHAMLRDAVHGEILPGPHTRLHLRFAQLIDEYPELVPTDRRAAEQAHHYQAAHDLPRAMEAAWWAALRAGDTLAFDEELDMLERVLSLWDRVPEPSTRVAGLGWAEVVSEAAGAALSAGRNRRVLELVDGALDSVPEDPEDDHTRTVRAVLLRRRGQVRAPEEREAGLADLLRALELHPPHMPDFAQLLATLARETLLLRNDRTTSPEQLETHMAAIDGRSPRELAERAIEVAGKDDEASTCAAADARITLGAIEMAEGDPERGRPLLEEGIRRAAAVAEPVLEARGAGDLGYFLHRYGLHREGLEVLEGSLARHEELGWASVHKAPTHLNRAEIHFELGELATARDIIRGTLDAASRERHRPYILAVGARIAAAVGDLSAARAAVGPGGDRSMLTEHRVSIVQLRALSSLETALAEADVDEALSLSRAVLEASVMRSTPGYAWPLLEAMGEAARQGVGRRRGTRTVEAARLVRDLVGAAAEPLPAETGVSPAHAATVAALLAEVDGAAPAEQAELWGAAVSAWEATPLVLNLARARLRAAEVLVSTGDRDRAADLVRRVHGVATACGARPLAGASEALARRLGTGVSEDAAPPPAPAGLTARELEVLRLLSLGGTNAQIAEELFVSPKTASVHVSNILAKLDVPNRATAGARARELGLG
ncbi:helix-turn-helix transcriptional regulator [Nocardiopsis nanhaiensis]